MGSNPIMDNFAWVPEWSKGLDSSSNAYASWVRIPPHVHLDIAQLVERGTVVPQVTGSSPVAETLRWYNGKILAFQARDPGSIPGRSNLVA